MASCAARCSAYCLLAHRVTSSGPSITSAAITVTWWRHRTAASRPTKLYARLRGSVCVMPSCARPRSRARLLGPLPPVALNAAMGAMKIVGIADRTSEAARIGHSAAGMFGCSILCVPCSAAYTAPAMFVLRKTRLITKNFLSRGMSLRSRISIVPSASAAAATGGVISSIAASFTDTVAAIAGLCADLGKSPVSTIMPLSAARATNTTRFARLQCAPGSTKAATTSVAATMAAMYSLVRTGIRASARRSGLAGRARAAL